MTVYYVTYDLNSPGQKYKEISDYLKQFTYCKNLESFWLIDTLKTAAQIRDDLKSKVDANDVIFVARLQGNWASWNYRCAEWLNDSKRNW